MPDYKSWFTLIVSYLDRECTYLTIHYLHTTTCFCVRIKFIYLITIISFQHRDVLLLNCNIRSYATDIEMYPC